MNVIDLMTCKRFLHLTDKHVNQNSDHRFYLHILHIVKIKQIILHLIDCSWLNVTVTTVFRFKSAINDPLQDWYLREAVTIHFSSSSILKLLFLSKLFMLNVSSVYFFCRLVKKILCSLKYQYNATVLRIKKSAFAELSFALIAKWYFPGQEVRWKNR